VDDPVDNPLPRVGVQSEELEAAGAGEEVLEDDVVEDVEDVDEEDPERESVR